MRTVRAALTQTINAYEYMPDSVKGLRGLKNRLEDVRAANVAHNIALIRVAAGAGAKIVCLGELCTGPYFAMVKDPMWTALAEDAATGPSVSAFAAAAKASKIVVVAPIYERAGKRRFNTAVVIEADGTIIGK